MDQHNIFKCKPNILFFMCWDCIKLRPNETPVQFYIPGCYIFDLDVGHLLDQSSYLFILIRSQEDNTV